MIYEMRTYYAVAGMIPILNERFDKHIIPVFKQHGIGILGFWTNDIGRSNQLIYILSYDSMADREQKFSAAIADPKVQSILADRPTPTIRVVSTFMKPTDYSPEPKMRGQVHELRIYRAAAGKMDDLHNRFSNHTRGFFQKHGIEEVGYWTEAIGDNSLLVYMLGYSSLAEREARFGAFGADPDWQKVVAETHKNGVLSEVSWNTILRPTAYSPR